jgi:hypothetical protein
MLQIRARLPRVKDANIPVAPATDTQARHRYCPRVSGARRRALSRRRGTRPAAALGARRHHRLPRGRADWAPRRRARCLPPWSGRASASRLINAQVGEIAITKNISEGFNVIAAALPWRAGDNSGDHCKPRPLRGRGRRAAVHRAARRSRKHTRLYMPANGHMTHMPDCWLPDCWHAPYTWRRGEVGLHRGRLTQVLLLRAGNAMHPHDGPRYDGVHGHHLRPHPLHCSLAPLQPLAMMESTGEVRWTIAIVMSSSPAEPAR